MKTFLLSIIILLSTKYLFAQHDMQNMKGMTNDTKNLQDSVYYTCVMHPEIHQAKAGDCPKCGMTLIKKTIKRKKQNPNQPVTKFDLDNNLHQDSIHSNKVKTDSVALPGTSHVHKEVPTKKYIGKTIRYDITLMDTIVEYGGKKKRAIAANGQIPMPTLTFTEGDTAEIYVHNELNEATAVHWHGLFLPNKMDGVPYLTQMPIKAHSTYIYTFPIVQNGTHWYHSHSKLQEQIGMYGAFIMKKPESASSFRKGIDDLPTIPIVLSEWTNMKPEEVHRSLKNATDWFAIKKGTTQSYFEAIKQGYFKTKITNEWKRMNAMDVSDVFYDNFLINGQNQIQYSKFNAGDKVDIPVNLTT